MGGEGVAAHTFREQLVCFFNLRVFASVSTTLRISEDTPLKSMGKKRIPLKEGKAIALASESL
jgi:hypothetical protein